MGFDGMKIDWFCRKKMEKNFACQRNERKTCKMLLLCCFFLLQASEHGNNKRQGGRSGVTRHAKQIAGHHTCVLHRLLFVVERR